jgi:endonuclease YncB( thermonuclease family)
MKKKTNGRSMALALILMLAVLAGVLVVATRDEASAAARQTSAPASGAAFSESEVQYAEGVVDIVLGDTITVSGEGATVEGTTVSIGAAGVYCLSGTLADGQIVVDAKGKVYLEFNGVDVTSSSGPALLITDAKKATLTLVEGTSNSLTDSAGTSEYDAALYTNDTLIINGRGSLAVTGNSNEGISSDDDIIVNAGTVVVTAVDDGLNAHDDITITGGDVYVRAGGDGLDSNGTINITGGTVIASGNSIAAPSHKSTQASVYVSTGSTQAAGTSFSIVLDGEEIVAFTPDMAYQNLFVSSDDLLADMAYDVYVGSSSVPISAIAAIVPAGAMDVAQTGQAVAGYSE